MNLRLNYYSRYNRIKNPKDIASLYHLMQGLNLETILSDDLILRISEFQAMHMRAKNSKTEFISNLSSIQGRRKGSYTQIEVQQDGFDEQEQDIRAASCGKKFQRYRQEEDDHNIRINYIKNAGERLNDVKDLRIDENNIIIQNRSQQSKEGIRNSYESKNKTNNLSEMNCLETESIPDNVEQDENKSSSPIREMDNYYAKQKEEDKGREDGVDFHKQYNSQALETSKKQVQKSSKNKIQNYKSSNFDEQFSQGLDELKKTQEIRNSSYINMLKQQIYSQDRNRQNEDGTRSEKLHRLHGSDIEMQMRDQGQDQDYEIGNMEEGGENLFRFGNNDEQNEGNVEVHEFKTYQFSEHSEPDASDEQSQQSKSGKSAKNKDFILQNGENEAKQMAKIPQKALTQGLWPNRDIQKSTEVTVSIQNDQSPHPSTYINKYRHPQSSNITEKSRKPFKKCIMDKKLNPRMVVSTIMHDGPVKKVNFKKMMKKQSSENRLKQQVNNNSNKKRKQESVQQSKQLLKAFFDQN